MKVFIKISLIYTTPTDVPARGVKNKHCSPVCFNALNFVYLRKYNRCIETQLPQDGEDQKRLLLEGWLGII